MVHCDRAIILNVEMEQLKLHAIPYASPVMIAWADIFVIQATTSANRKNHKMKKLIKTFGICSLSFFTLTSHAEISPLKITGAFATVFSTERGANRKLDIYGNGFFPGNDLAVAMNDTQVTYRQIAPRLSDWKNASSASGADAWIETFGPNEVDMSLSDAILQPNTAWSFIICSRTVGCSNALNIQVQGPGAPTVQVTSGANTSDVGVGSGGSNGSPLYFPVVGFSNYTPFIRVGNFNYYGEYVPATQDARFMLPSSLLTQPGVYTAFLEDSITGVDSGAFSLRVFGSPNVVSGAPLAITEFLGFGGSPTDATIKLKFSDMTFPATFQYVDGTTVRSLNIPMDLVTGNATITIPADWLRVGNYSTSLVMENAGGRTTLPVVVAITKSTIIPIPHPFPTPIHPFPTPVHP